MSEQQLPGLSSRHYDRHYYDEHRAAGLDYLHCGAWQLGYGRWLANVFGHGRVLDVGCACGGNLRGLWQAGCDVTGVDLSQFMVDMGRLYWPELAGRLFCCDAVHLHLWPDATFDWIHSAQVAEHWRPDLAGKILEELARVTKPGGHFFCALDTAELFERQGRLMAAEDPTHICIRPIDWWHQHLQASGWRIVTAQWRDRLAAGSDSYLRLYDWDFFVAKRAV